MSSRPLPPPARHPYGGSAALGVAAALLSGLGLVAIGLWIARGIGEAAAQPLRAGGGVLLWLACSALALHWLRSLPEGVLQWDGEAWLLERSAVSERFVPLREAPEVALDLQGALLLRVRPVSGPAQWLWLQARSAPAQWAALRRALYARPPMATVPGTGAGPPVDARTQTTPPAHAAGPTERHPR